MSAFQPASSRQITLLRKLSMRKHRYREKLWIAEGMRSVEQILSNRHNEVLHIFLGKDISDPPTFIPSSAKLSYIEPELLDTLSDTDTPQGILAICRMPEEADPRNMAANGSGVILALDAVQDPGNLGTIIRTASWFNVTAIIAGTGTTDPYHPKTVRSTAGATGVTPLMTGDIPGLLNLFHTFQWTITYLDSGPDSTPIHEASRSDKQILVLGNEGNGISREVKNLGFPSVHIPGNNESVESLNVAMACGISLYHFS